MKTVIRLLLRLSELNNDQQSAWTLRALHYLVRPQLDRHEWGVVRRRIHLNMLSFRTAQRMKMMQVFGRLVDRNDCRTISLFNQSPMAGQLLLKSLVESTGGRLDRLDRLVSIAIDCRLPSCSAFLECLLTRWSWVEALSQPTRMRLYCHSRDVFDLAVCNAIKYLIVVRLHIGSLLLGHSPPLTSSKGKFLRPYSSTHIYGNVSWSFFTRICRLNRPYRLKGFSVI